MLEWRSALHARPAQVIDRNDDEFPIHDAFRSHEELIGRAAPDV
jgi:hypothetical protein